MFVDWINCFECLFKHVVRNLSGVDVAAVDAVVVGIVIQSGLSFKADFDLKFNFD